MKAFLVSLLISAGAVLPLTPAAQGTVGIIDLYGLKTVTKESVLSALRVSEGDTLAVSTDSLQNRIRTIPGVRDAKVTAVCCVEGKRVLFAGIRETPVKDYPWRVIREEERRLPPVLIQKYTAYLAALRTAVSKGDNGDNLSAGHSLFRNPALRRIQKEFIPLADRYFTQIAAVLQHSSLVAQREAAAVIIAYASNKQKVAAQYYEAMTDPSPGVRNNVFRALAALGVYAASHPAFQLKLRTDLFVWMLNSLYWSDRDKALFALMAITERRDEPLLKEIQSGALSSLVEMAGWKSKGHAVLAYVLLGRMAGVPEEEIFASWNENRQGLVLEKLVRP